MNVDLNGGKKENIFQPNLHWRIVINNKKTSKLSKQDKQRQKNTEENWGSFPNT